MDILGHGLWGAVGAKVLNKALARNGEETRLNVWWTGFWAVFPDLLAFTPLAISLAWSSFTGSTALESVRGVTGTLYPLGHSVISWAVAFGVVWLILRRPAWELLGWLSHIVLDIGTHPADFYPTRFLAPFSDFNVGGIAWATPAFLVANYALLFAFLYLLRAHRDIKEGIRAMTNTRKILLGLLAVIAVVGAWITFDRRAANNDTPPPPPAATETMAVQVFFSNDVFDPGIMECGRTYPVTRTISKTTAVGRAALEELLKSTTAEEAAEGYLTSINDGVSVNSLTIQDGVAHVDFNARLEENAGGSCHVAAIRSQIANTLKQFPTVNEVIIGVEGRVEDALQP